MKENTSPPIRPNYNPEPRPSKDKLDDRDYKLKMIKFLIDESVLNTSGGIDSLKTLNLIDKLIND